MKKIFLIITLTVFPVIAFAQNNDVQMGSGLNRIGLTQGGFFDCSDPSAVNIKVSVWGFVRFPGKYIIPVYSNVNDLISYAGGPTDEARLEEMRIVRTDSATSKQKIFNLSYNDFLMDPDIKVDSSLQSLKAGDVLLVSGSPRFYLRDYIGTILSIVSVLISVIILVRQK
ncbi:MAG: SLBB domain-containing protein [Ignavibacteriaceae bacterium]|nr:SLBB domain-containing protein [Ignavibacteriaceae bacterium]